MRNEDCISFKCQKSVPEAHRVTSSVPGAVLLNCLQDIRRWSFKCVETHTHVPVHLGGQCLYTGLYLGVGALFVLVSD